MKRSTFTALSAAAATVPRPALAQSTTTIRFGTAPVESYALPIYAQDGGFFGKHGIDANVTLFQGGGAVLAALIGGSLDYACVNWGATSNACVKGIPVAAIAAGGIYDSSAPTTVLAVGKNNTTIHSSKDLNGKTIGVSTLKDLQQASVMKWSDTNGGDSSTLRFIELPIPEIPPALQTGRLDAGIVLEPILTERKNDIRVLADCYNAVAKRLMISCELGMKDHLTSNAATTHKVVDALNETALWANANHDKAGEILARVSKLPFATIRSMNRTVYSDRLEVPTIQPVIDVSVEYHFLPHGYRAEDAFWSGLGKQ